MEQISTAGILLRHNLQRVKLNGISKVCFAIELSWVRITANFRIPPMADPGAGRGGTVEFSENRHPVCLKKYTSNVGSVDFPARCRISPIRRDQPIAASSADRGCCCSWWNRTLVAGAASWALHDGSALHCPRYRHPNDLMVSSSVIPNAVGSFETGGNYAQSAFDLLFLR